MRFSSFSLVFLASHFAKGDFILPQPMSHVSTGFPTQISWSTDPVTGPVSLFLVPEGVQDASASISAIGTQIPNDGMYQWILRDTPNAAESYFSILMVDSKNVKTVSGTFLIVGLQSFQTGFELRRRVDSGTKSSDSGKNEGYKKYNSTETKTVKSKSKEPSKSAAQETSLPACSAVVTKTKYLYLDATNGANTETKSSDGSESTGAPASLGSNLKRRSTDISVSSKPMNIGKRFPASNSTSRSKSTFQNSSLKHNYGLNSSSTSEAGIKKGYDSQSSSSGFISEKGSGSKHSASNSNSKGSSGSESSSSGHNSKGTKDSSSYKPGSKESDEYGHGHGHGSSSNSSSGHESNSTLRNTSTQTDCTLVTSTTIIYVSSSIDTHTQETKTYTSNINKTTLIQTNTIISIASESLFSISTPATPASSSILASTSTLAVSTISLAGISTFATSTIQNTQVSHVSETSQVTILAPPESMQSTPIFSTSISIPSITSITTPPSPMLTSLETTQPQ
ncbi:hypothetical protein BOTNAR_3191g00010 [Botryotinia narcissicola]|uniref:Yeast cell wall synthesis Kre9/Knh1-like N-terminal domain-containing protein n=1 Tax=Botryotinia narcissicola TaxID=278944 RepID=A0A4Z1H4W8_9HELO|nr:hypothetical protein BOTNAR_3191g00010 [Botryotinia narcissicola]